MSFAKGMFIKITVEQRRITKGKPEWHKIADGQTYLDTDTVNDWLDEYNPDNHRLIIEPAEEPTDG